MDQRRITVPKARSVKNDDPILSRRLVDKAARGKILNHAAVAMQQNQWLALTALKVVEANAFYFDEFTHWRVVTLGLLRNEPVDERGDRECRDNDGGTYRYRVRCGIPVQ